MRPPACVACDLPVLELTGQSVTLSPYLIRDGSPPPATAGAWHVSCLNAGPAGDRWGQALERNYLDVRGFALVARTPNWVVVRNPRTGEVLGLGGSGVSLPLRGPGLPFRTRHGHAYPIREPVYWLEWNPGVIAALQDGLRRAGFIRVREVAAALGVDHRLSHPELLDGSSFRFDESLTAEWTPAALGASVEYVVPLPEELVPYYESRF